MNHAQHSSMNGKHYQKLVIMTVLSFISMYILMYSMVDRFNNVIPNVNQFYMAGLMTMPMIIIEVMLMRSMYMNKKLNVGIIAASIILLAGFYVAIRQQAAVSEKQFLNGMIPHHAAAILMSKKNPAKDPEIVKLQQEIISSQEREIAEMKAILERMKNK
jgi:uncharacterized protein (DUF305 family)